MVGAKKAEDTRGENENLNLHNIATGDTNSTSGNVQQDRPKEHCSAYRSRSLLCIDI